MISELKLKLLNFMLFVNLYIYLYFQKYSLVLKKMKNVKNCANKLLGASSAVNKSLKVPCFISETDIT
jgi:hypothetical protein